MKSSRTLFLVLALVVVLSLAFYRYYGQRNASSEISPKEPPTPTLAEKAPATPSLGDKALDGPTPTSVKETPSPLPSEAPPVQKPVTDLCWKGTYRGFLPCASCEGIFTTVVLKPDKTYEKEEIYLGEKDGVFHEEGRILFGEKSSKITLETRNTNVSYNYQVEPEGLRMLDSEGNPSLGTLAEMYRLRKMSPKDVAFGEKPVTGYLTMGHNLSTFSPCGSEKTFWIDDPENRLRGLYQKTLGENADCSMPVMAELKVADRGRAMDGLAKDYSGVLEVTEIISVAPMTEENNGLR